MNETVLYSMAEGVATITLNRPQVLNALDAQMIVALRAACERAEHDTAARAVVLRGAGPAFLVGEQPGNALEVSLREGGSQLQTAEGSRQIPRGQGGPRPASPQERGRGQAKDMRPQLLSTNRRRALGFRGKVRLADIGVPKERRQRQNSDGGNN